MVVSKPGGNSQRMVTSPSTASIAPDLSEQRPSWLVLQPHSKMFLWSLNDRCCVSSVRKESARCDKQQRIGCNTKIAIVLDDLKHQVIFTSRRGVVHEVQTNLMVVKELPL